MKYRRIARITMIALCVCIALCCIIYLSADRGPAKLSDMSNEECKAFLVERGLIIPDYNQDANYKAIIEVIEEDMDNPSLFGFQDPRQNSFMRRIQSIVRDYYSGGTP